MRELLAQFLDYLMLERGLSDNTQALINIALREE